MQSILLKLVDLGYIEKSNLILQVRPRGSLGGPLFCMELNPEQRGCQLISHDTIITGTYAYLDDERMCIFLNRSMLTNQIQTIEMALQTLTSNATPLQIETETQQLQVRRQP